MQQLETTDWIHTKQHEWTLRIVLTKKQTHIHNTISINFKFIQQDIYTVAVQSLSRVRLFVTPWTTARQGSLSITISLSLLKFMSIYTVNTLKNTH